MTRGFVTGAPLGSYSTYCFVRPSPLSFSFFLFQILSWRERARELPRLHLGASGPYYKIGGDVINVKLSIHHWVEAKVLLANRQPIESMLTSTIGAIVLFDRCLQPIYLNTFKSSQRRLESHSERNLFQNRINILNLVYFRF